MLQHVIQNVTDLSMGSADHLHPVTLCLGLQQRVTDAVLHNILHVFWVAVRSVLDVQMFCSEVNIVVLLGK